MFLNPCITASWKADSAYISDLCRITFDLNEIINSKSFIHCQTNPYEDILVSTDMTKVEQARHKLVVEQLKCRRARGEIDNIRGDSIFTRSKSQRQQTESRNQEVVHWK